MLSTAITLAAETSEHGDPVVSPYVIGAIALGLLLLRPHGSRLLRWRTRAQLIPWCVASG